MEIRSGWASEYARKKYDVTLDEGDLARVLVASGIPLDELAFMSVDDAHTLLYTSAEIMARRALSQFDPGLKEQLVKEASALNSQRAAAVARVRAAREKRQQADAGD